MQIRPIKKRFFVKLNLIWALVFLIGFAIILYSINPFEASVFQMILFYTVLFLLLLGIFNLLRALIEIPFWILFLIDLVIIFFLLIRSFRV